MKSGELVHVAFTMVSAKPGTQCEVVDHHMHTPIEPVGVRDAVLRTLYQPGDLIDQPVARDVDHAVPVINETIVALCEVAARHISRASALQGAQSEAAPFVRMTYPPP